MAFIMLMPIDVFTNTHRFTNLCLGRQITKKLFNRGSQKTINYNKNYIYFVWTQVVHIQFRKRQTEIINYQKRKCSMLLQFALVTRLKPEKQSQKEGKVMALGFKRHSNKQNWNNREKKVMKRRRCDRKWHFSSYIIALQTIKHAQFFLIQINSVIVE